MGITTPPRPALAAAGVLLAVQACASVPFAGGPSAPPIVQSLLVNGHRLTLHLSAASEPGGPLIVFATGDGGWRRKDLDAYRHIVSWGTAAVGFSAPEYIKSLHGDAETTTPARLAADYSTIVDAAEATLHVADAPVVLVGVSRGAGLVVAAAGQPVMHDRIAGVIAVALTREEEHVRFRRRRRSTNGPASTMLDTYGYLARLDPVPLVVIQSTRDSYLPAAEARRLFGPDTPRRRLIAIDARNHSFAGARAHLYDAIRQSLSWIEGQRMPAGTP